VNQIYLLHEELPPGHRLFEIHGWAKRHGASRLARAAGLIGEEEARAVAKKLGSYLLDDEIVRSLAFAGAALGPGGEFPCLSPSRWAEGNAPEDGQGFSAWRAQWEREGCELAGLVLRVEERARLLAFLSLMGKAPPADPWQLLEITDFFLVEDSLKLALRYTAPRLNRP
jgi:hypothetical protein